MKDITKIGKVMAFLQVVEYYKPQEKSYYRAGFKLWNPLSWLTILILIIYSFIAGGIPDVVEYFKDMRVMINNYSAYKAERRNKSEN